MRERVAAASANPTERRADLVLERGGGVRVADRCRGGGISGPVQRRTGMADSVRDHDACIERPMRLDPAAGGLADRDVAHPCSRRSER